MKAWILMHWFYLFVAAFIVMVLAAMIADTTPKNSVVHTVSGLIMAAIFFPLTAIVVYYQEKRDDAYHNRKKGRRYR